FWRKSLRSWERTFSPTSSCASALYRSVSRTPLRLTGKRPVLIRPAPLGIFQPPSRRASAAFRMTFYWNDCAHYFTRLQYPMLVRPALLLKKYARAISLALSSFGKGRVLGNSLSWQARGGRVG